MTSSTRTLIAQLTALSVPERATFDRNYNKSSRQHFGISSGKMEEAIEPFIRNLDAGELLKIAQELWETDAFDFMITATKILKSKRIPRDKKLWSIGKKFLKDCDGWCLMDSLSMSMRDVILQNPELLKEVDKWTRHKSFWMRRAALVFTLPFAKPGRDPEPMLAWAAIYADDPEWFIQKAIGWWLRDLGSHNPERVIQFLNQHWDRLKYVAKNEATRKLDQQWIRKLDVNR